MNDKLQRLIDNCDECGVDLSRTDIDVRYSIITFFQGREDRNSFRAVKRWVGGFKASGSPPYVKLERNIDIEYMLNGEYLQDSWLIKWDGAYECRSKGYDCRPALFADEAEDHAADIDIEDSQLANAL